MGFFYSMACMGIFAYPIMWLLALIPWTGRRTIKETGNKGFNDNFVSCFCNVLYNNLQWAERHFDILLIMHGCFFLPIIYVVLIMYSKASEKSGERYVTIIMIVLAIASFAITAMVCNLSEWSDIKYDSPVLFYYIKQIMVFKEK